MASRSHTFTHKLFFLLLFSLLFSVVSYTQRPRESDYPANIQEVIDQAIACLTEEKENCNDSYYEAISLAKETNDIYLIGRIYCHAANTYKFMQGPKDENEKLIKEGLIALHNSSEYESQVRLYRNLAELKYYGSPSSEFLPYLDTALVKSKLVGDNALIAGTYIEFSEAYKSLGDVAKGIEQLVMAKEYAQASENQEIISQTLFTLASTYDLNEDFELANQYFDQTLASLRIQGDTMRYMYAMTNWCHNMISLDRPAETIDSLKLIISYAKHQGQKIVVPYAQSQLSRAYFLLESFDAALIEAKQSLERCKELEIDNQSAYNQMIISQCYSKLNKPDQALQYSQGSFDFHQTQSLSGDQIESYENHAKVLELNGRYKESMTTYKLYLEKKDSIYNEEKMKEITRLQTLLDVEEKENELCSKESEISILEAKNQTSRSRNIALVIGLILLGVLAYALVNRQKLKTTKERSLAEKKEFENKQLSQEIEYKNRQLTSNALSLTRKNQFLKEIEDQLLLLTKKLDAEPEINSIRNKLKIETKMENNWLQFTEQFKETNPAFYNSLTNKYENLTKNELRMAALLKMKLTNKDIAHMLNISDEGVKKARYRMRKKFELQKEDSLERHIASIG